MKEKVMITGGAGFIGSHLIERISREPVGSIRAFVHYNSRNSWGWLEECPVAKEIEVVTGDIRDYDSVKRCMQDCDVVYHLAALIGIPYSYVSPKAYLEVNIGGTYNILQAAREVGCHQVLVTSTSETYGTAQTHAISEDHPHVAQSPYAATKIAADQIALSYFRSFGLPVKIVRPFNTFGPRQSARAIIPTVISQIMSGAARIKIGNHTPTRDLTYVQDTVEGFISIAKCDKLIGEACNIGRNEEVSVGELVNTIARLVGRDVEVEVDAERVRGHTSEVHRLRCDNSKIVQLAGWRPQNTLDEGLIKTIEWFRGHSDLYKSSVYNV